MTTSDIIIETLIDWGVDRIFGIPGDGINGVMESLRKRQDKIRFIQVRHEEAAAFMACGHAKFTGKLGACIATSGPGGIHLLNGLYDAKLDGQPVIAITGLQFHDLLGTHTQQDVALDKLFEDVTVYNERIMGPAHAENATELACRTALSRRGVAHITIPVDIQIQKGQKRSKRNIKNHVSNYWFHGAHAPNPNDVKSAADLINQGKKIAILAGRGALHATDELEELADTLGAPIVKALLGKAAVPDDSPFTTGTIGLLGTRPSQVAMEECDTFIIIGSSFPYIEFMPKPDQARAVQIDTDPTRIALRFPVEVGLVGDSKLSIKALMPHLKRKQNRAFLKKAQKGMKEWRELMQDRECRMDKPMKPQLVAAEVAKHLSDDAIVTCDSGTIATWWARSMPVKRGQMCSLSGTLATMAPGLPYAIAAQLAYPKRQVVAFVGDGGLSMLMSELATCVKYKLPIKIVVIKNNYLGQIQWEQMVFLGNPEFGCDLQPIDFAKVAEGYGLTGITLEEPKDASDVFERVMNVPGPVLVEAVVDPYEPPMPAKIKPEQALKFAESMARGTPNRTKIALTIGEDRVRELI